MTQKQKMLAVIDKMPDAFTTRQAQEVVLQMFPNDRLIYALNVLNALAKDGLLSKEKLAGCNIWKKKIPL